MMNKTRKDMAIRALLVITAVGIIAYWLVVFGKVVSIPSPVPGYVDWFMAFPLADLWIAAAATASFVAWKRNPQLARTLLIAAGSALIFLALNAFLYGYRTGLIFDLTTDELMEITIKVYCLVVGAFFVNGGYARLAVVS